MERGRKGGDVCLEEVMGWLAGWLGLAWLATFAGR